MSDKLTKICAELRMLQRTRASIIRSRIMAENNRRNFVANLLGYSPGLEETKRAELFEEADAIITDLVAGKIEHPASTFVLASQPGIESFEVAQKEIEKKMIPLAKQTPVAAWVEQPEQKGFGLLSLAVVIGETGDLRDYANPAKLWKRMGCHPWEFKGKTQMGSTWKSKGGLSAEEWTAFGYSPRRRSIMYVIGQSLVKGNYLDKEHEHPGPYRARYELKKADAIANRPEWTACTCKGTGKGARGGKCADCGGKGYRALRADRHGMLLATKLLLKNLWKAWNPAIDRGEYHDRAPAANGKARRKKVAV